MQTILKQLKEKAFLVLSQYHNNTLGNAPSPSSSIFNSQLDGMDELALFGGQTRILISKTLSQKSPNRQMKPNRTGGGASSSSSSSHPSPSSTSSNSGQDRDVFPDIHPSLVRYMSLLPQESLDSNFTHHAASNFGSQNLESPAVNGSAPVDWNAHFPGANLQSEMTAPAGSDSYVNDPKSLNLLQELYQEAPVTTIDTWGGQMI